MCYFNILPSHTHTHWSLFDSLLVSVFCIVYASRELMCSFHLLWDRIVFLLNCLELCAIFLRSHIDRFTGCPQPKFQTACVRYFLASLSFASCLLCTHREKKTSSSSMVNACTFISFLLKGKTKETLCKIVSIVFFSSPIRHAYCIMHFNCHCIGSGLAGYSAFVFTKHVLSYPSA